MARSIMNLLLGYQSGSAVHKLDPRVKLLWLVGNALLVLWAQDARVAAWTLGMVLLTIRLAGISLRVLLPLMKITAIIGVQLVLLQGILRSEGSVLLQVGFVSVCSGGLLRGLTGMLILVTLMLSFLQFIMCTSPEELTLMMVKLRMPPRYAVLVGLALRFLPLVEGDLRMIQESQQSRGLELSTLRQKAKGLFPILVPLILRTVQRAQQVALSMELKGYGLHRERTFLGGIAFSRRDALVFSVLSAYFCAEVSFLVC